MLQDVLNAYPMISRLYVHFANLYFSLIELWRPFSAFDRELKWWLNLKEVFLQWQFPWPASAVQWQCRVWGVGFLNVDIGTLMQSLSKLRYWGMLVWDDFLVPISLAVWAVWGSCGAEGSVTHNIMYPRSRSRYTISSPLLQSIKVKFRKLS